MLYRDDTKLKIALPANFELPEGLTNDFFEQNEFDATIHYTTTTPSNLQIKILYHYTLHLHEIIELLIDKGLNLLESIKTASDDEHIILDLSNSKIINIEDDGSKWENDNRFTLITLDFCRKIINANLGIPHSEFSLTEGGLHLLDELYDFELFGYDNPYSFNVKEKEYHEIILGKYRLNFILKFEVFSEENINELRIRRWPRLIISEVRKEFIEDESLLYSEIESIMNLLSYFQNQKIHYTYGRIKRENSTIEYNLTKEKKGFDLPKASPLKENGTSVYYYLNSCDFDFILLNSEFVANLINRFIYSEYLEGESKFMILYNLIEQTRNFFIQISIDKDESIIINDEYNFKLSKSKTDKIINNKIKELSEIVIEAEQEFFKQNANKKVNFIKKKLMQNQFDEFFKYIDINLEDYDLNFIELLKIRNVIYHGGNYKSTGIELESNIHKLRKLVSTVIEYILYNKKNASNNV
jgi:hypothetical protein